MASTTSRCRRLSWPATRSAAAFIASLPQYPAVSNGQRVASGDVQLGVSTDGDPGKLTLVFLHGYPETKEVWDAVRRLLASDFHTVAYDVRGAGESSAPRRSASYDFRPLGDDLDAVIDAVAGAQRVHLIGLLVPERDRFIPLEHYERAQEHVPELRRHSIDTTHWAQLTHPDEVAQWIREFVAGVEQAG